MSAPAAPQRAEDPGRQQVVLRLLEDWRAGDASAYDRLIPLVYTELKRLARGQLAREQTPHSVDATVLVHEAYLRLVGAEVDWRDRTHFLSTAARVMRRVLVERARARGTRKRGGDGLRVSLATPIPAPSADPVDMLALDEALERLQKADGRIADVVQLRYFGGLTVDETAQALGCSRDTVMRDWKTARLWLAHELGGLRPSGR